MKSDQKPLKRKEKREATKAVDENLNRIRSNVSALRSMVLEMDTETDGKLPLANYLFIVTQNKMICWSESTKKRKIMSVVCSRLLTMRS